LRNLAELLGIKVMNDRSYEEESQIVTRLADVLANHILPLYTVTSGGIPKLVGTGFLVFSGISTYLLSAAHVFDELKNGHELFFYIDHDVIRKISGKVLITKTPAGGNRKADRLDIGIHKLEGFGLPHTRKWDKHPYPLPIDALMPNLLPREGKHYLLIGFPESQNRANPIAREIVPKPYNYRSCSAPLSHIVLNFDRKRTIGSNGQIRAFPEPLGVSGSPLWLLYNENGPNDPNQTAIVGIAIEHHKNHHAIIATDIDIALKLINEFKETE
jgi:hypothetical protein